MVGIPDENDTTKVRVFNMTTMQIKSHEMFSVDVTARESDEYSKLAFLKIELNYHPEKVRGTNELFLTTEQLRDLGRFLITEAMIIEEQQRKRDLFK